MIGEEPSATKDGEWSARELKGKIKGVHDKLQGMLDAMQKQKNTQFLKDDYEALKKKIATIDPVDPNEKEDDVPVTWELQNFYHLPLAAVMTNLSKIQSDIKNVEAEVVNQFAAASGKVSVKFNQLAARVVAPSSYIQAGQPYTADIFIAASSDAFKEDNMQILLGVDSAEAAKGSAGSGAVKIVNGIGKYEVGTSGQGDQEYKGVIKFKKPTGEYDYYPFNGKYTVAAPSVAVSPDKMNLFYIGVPNPVTISAAGVAPSNLVVSASGGGVRIAQKGGGKFEVMATTPGDCNVSVSAKTADGTKPQGPPIKFRVKRIPDPVAKLGGKLGYGTLEFPKLQLNTIGGIVAEVPGFDFDAKFIVTQFVMTAVIKGNLKEMSANGNSLSSEMKGVLSQLGPGGKVFFENIKAKGPDGSLRTLGNVTIKVK
jgi:gliding motility-associated protein GldM